MRRPRVVAISQRELVRLNEIRGTREQHPVGYSAASTFGRWQQTFEQVIGSFAPSTDARVLRP